MHALSLAFYPAVDISVVLLFLFICVFYFQGEFRFLTFSFRMASESWIPQLLQEFNNAYMSKRAAIVQAVSYSEIIS